MRSRWGALHRCPDCGALVQWDWGPTRARPTRVEAGTTQPHRCPAPGVGPEDHLLCLCGTPVYLLNGRRYTMDGRPHRCPAREPQPLPAATPKPPAKPVPDGHLNGKLSSNGFLILADFVVEDGEDGSGQAAPGGR